VRNWPSRRGCSASGLTYSIVRPTAFFKSLSGQIARVRAGKPFLLFGDGTLTACKPISDDDLGRFIASCLTIRTRRTGAARRRPGPGVDGAGAGRVAVRRGGDGAAVPAGTRGDDGRDHRAGGFLGRFSAKWADRAEFARTGRYYATESMLVWDAAAGRYDADATPEFGNDTLAEHYARLIAGEAEVDLREHAVF
jgi:divinyl chlorophyllide a 8-vinyl-reductase